MKVHYSHPGATSMNPTRCGWWPTRALSQTVSTNLLKVECKKCLELAAKDNAKKDAADWEAGQERARDAGL